MTESHGCSSNMLRAERQWNNWNARCKTLARMNEFTLATTLTPATQKSAAIPNRAPRYQGTRQSAARPPQSTGHAEQDST